MNRLPLLPRLLLAGLFAASCAHAANLCTQPRPGRNLDRHEAICAAVKTNPGAQLVFIGDSITQQWGGVPSLKHGAYGAPVWAAHFEKHQALNLGVSADKTENVLWRLKNGALDGLSPKVFVLLVGTNNCVAQNGTPVATPEETVAGVEAIVRLLKEKSPKSKVVLLGVLPRNFHGKDTPAQVAFPGQVNTLLAARFKSVAGISYLDMTGSFVDADGAPKKALFYDGLHPNTAGYEQLAKQLSPVLAKLM